MDYLNLKMKFGNVKIPYAELLNTSEWKERRLAIIKRDKSCCTNCGRTQSFYFSNFNVSFQNNDKLLPESINYTNKSIDDIKKELRVDKITILKSAHDLSAFCGITDFGHLFLTDWNMLDQIPKSELVVNYCKTKFGKEFYIINKKGNVFDGHKYSIPELTESPILIHVHHKFYIKEKLPWQYEDDALITLCNLCHWELHEQTTIPVYSFEGGVLKDLNYTPCIRCNGAGFFPEYKHVQNGVCFRCKGERYEELITTF